MKSMIERKQHQADEVAFQRYVGPMLNGRPIFKDVTWSVKAVCVNCLAPNAPLKVYCAECEKRAKELMGVKGE